MWNHINKNLGMQYVCISSDEKRTDVPNGSILLEMDTGIFYLFNESKKFWEPQAIGAASKTSDLILIASNGAKFKIIVSPDGTLSTEIVA